MQISLALSGGGFRAVVYHLGVLTHLARENQLENIDLLSTVSVPQRNFLIQFLKDNFTSR
jgi:predicted acylesterase/phospholipase RssA